MSSADGPPSLGPPQPGDRSGGLIALVVVCCFLCVTFVGLRMIRAWKIRTFRLEDGVILSALVLILVPSILNAVATRYGSGKHISAIPTQDLYWATRLPLVAAPILGVDVFLAKLSVGLTLMHLDISRTYKLCVAFGVFISFVGNLFYIIALSNTCRPTDARAGTTPLDQHCFSLNTAAVASYTQASCNIFTDIALVVIPLWYLRKVRLSSRDRAALNVLLYLMLTATVVSVLKLANLPTFNAGLTDITWVTVVLSMYGIAEAAACVIAACLPAIRQLLGNKFPRWLLFGQTRVDETARTFGGTATTASVAHKMGSGPGGRLDGISVTRSTTQHVGFMPPKITARTPKRELDVERDTELSHIFAEKDFAMSRSKDASDHSFNDDSRSDERPIFGDASPIMKSPAASVIRTKI